MAIYKAAAGFTSDELHQTDFGRIYFATPEESHAPKTIEELRTLLRSYHQKGIKVTIRNTGHSMNGQTVTDGVQIRIGNIKGITFHEDRLRVTAHAGDSWDDVFTAIQFPKYCVPVWPNNPGQKIHMSGTLTMGGIGPQSFSRGGFWNYVESLTLVTMTGEVIECSRTQNARYFAYAVAGLGRIGVVVRFTVRVEKSSAHVVVTEFPVVTMEGLKESLDILKHDGRVGSVMSSYQMSSETLLDKIGTYGSSAVAFTVEGDKDHVAFIAEDVCGKVRPLVHAHMQTSGDDLAITPWNTVLEKKAWVYTYPHEEKPIGRCNPWADVVVPERNFGEMLAVLRKSIREYALEKFIMRHSDSRHIMNVDIIVSYLIKKVDTYRYPLSLEITGEHYACHTGISFECDPEDVPLFDAFTDEMTDICHSFGGKRYLYGMHAFTNSQLEKQFGRDVLDEWERIKHELDPKYLLNTQAIRMKPGHVFG